jgi:hybrid cluster-associated redox disulfide protein
VYNKYKFDWEGKMMAKVTKDMIISEVLRMDKGTVPIFMSAGMHCLGCPSASGESIEDACAVHGIDADQLVKDLNDYLENK